MKTNPAGILALAETERVKKNYRPCSPLLDSGSCAALHNGSLSSILVKKKNELLDRKYYIRCFMNDEGMNVTGQLLWLAEELLLN